MGGGSQLQQRQAEACSQCLAQEMERNHGADVALAQTLRKRLWRADFAGAALYPSLYLSLGRTGEAGYCGFERKMRDAWPPLMA